MSDNLTTERFTLKYNIMCPQVRSLLFIREATNITFNIIKGDNITKEIIKSVNENQQAIEDTPVTDINLEETNVNGNQQAIEDTPVTDINFEETNVNGNQQATEDPPVTDINFEETNVNGNQQETDGTSIQIKIIKPLVRLCNSEDTIVPIENFHAICTYLLNDSGANHSLYPIDPLERAKIDDFMFLHGERILGGLLKPLDLLRLDYSEIKTEEINELYIKINDELKKGELKNLLYIAEEKCTVADLFLMATVETFNIFVPLDNVSELQNLKNWYDRVNKNELYTEGRKETIKSYVKQHTSHNKDFLSTNNISLDRLSKKLFNHVKYYLKPIREVCQSTDDHISEAYGKIKLILKKNGPYIFGENLTIADLFLMGTVHTLQKFDHLSELPELTAWYDYVLLNNSFIKRINNLYTDEFGEHYQSLMKMIKIRKEFEKFSEIFNKPPINRN